MSCEYEKLRQNNIIENRRILTELGLLEPLSENVRLKVKLPIKPKPKTPSIRRIKEISTNSSDENHSPIALGTRRRSERLLGKTPKQEILVWDDDDEDDEAFGFKVKTKPKPAFNFPRFRENIMGAIPGVPVGTVFSSRLEASYAGVHRPTVAGIHGSETDGCYSLALSGGYEDDVDLGDCFTYTGAGGRDLKGTKINPKNLRTAPQSKDQTLTRGNLALTKNIEFNRPVRVIRGFKSSSPFAPDEGYRYDGLYSVEKYWAATGNAGFLVFKYALKRCEDQESAPWSEETTTEEFAGKENHLPSDTEN